MKISVIQLTGSNKIRRSRKRIPNLMLKERECRGHLFWAWFESFIFQTTDIERASFYLDFFGSKDDLFRTMCVFHTPSKGGRFQSCFKNIVIKVHGIRRHHGLGMFVQPRLSASMFAFLSTLKVGSAIVFVVLFCSIVSMSTSIAIVRRTSIFDILSYSESLLMIHIASILPNRLFSCFQISQAGLLKEGVVFLQADCAAG